MEADISCARDLRFCFTLFSSFSFSPFSILLFGVAHSHTMSSDDDGANFLCIFCISEASKSRSKAIGGVVR